MERPQDRIQPVETGRTTLDELQRQVAATFAEQDPDGTVEQHMQRAKELLDNVPFSC